MKNVCLRRISSGAALFFLGALGACDAIRVFPLQKRYPGHDRHTDAGVFRHEPTQARPGHVHLRAVLAEQVLLADAVLAVLLAP